MKQLHLGFLTDEEFENLREKEKVRGREQKRLGEDVEEYNEFRRMGWRLYIGEKAEEFEKECIHSPFNNWTGEELIKTLEHIGQNSYLEGKQIEALAALRFYYLVSSQHIMELPAEKIDRPIEEMDRLRFESIGEDPKIWELYKRFEGLYLPPATAPPNF